jgi:hypothetical protein
MNKFIRNKTKKKIIYDYVKNNYNIISLSKKYQLSGLEILRLLKRKKIINNFMEAVGINSNLSINTNFPPIFFHGY